MQFKVYRCIKQELFLTMKMIKPIVNISRIIDNYDTIVLGMSGVISEGADILPDANDALQKLKKAGKKIVLLTNSALRVETIAEMITKNGLALNTFANIVSAGEIMHYMFKLRKGNFATIGNTYFNLGNSKDNVIFSGLEYEAVDKLGQADFLFIGSPSHPQDTIDKYMQIMEFAASMNVPLVCVGNDTSGFVDGEICIAAGAVAEQYAALGGQIITIGKPESRILEYALEGIGEKEKTLLIGDSITTDIRGANLYGIDSMLISKGVHINYLGEGYIPDVAKTRELSNNFEAYPNYVISNLRW